MARTYCSTPPSALRKTIRSHLMLAECMCFVFNKLFEDKVTEMYFLTAVQLVDLVMSQDYCNPYDPETIMQHIVIDLKDLNPKNFEGIDDETIFEYLKEVFPLSKEHHLKH